MKRESLLSAPPARRLRFDRHELAGAFGDIGTDLPLLVALIATCRLDAASVCIVFGALQILTGVYYGIPMPVQPLKAMAAIMLAQRLAPGVLAGGGFVIGVAMLLLATTGLLDLLARVVPREVVRGIQLGLGITLATLALRDYVAADGRNGYIVAIAAFGALLVLRRQRRIPGPLVVVAVAVAYGFIAQPHYAFLGSAVGLRVPTIHVPTNSEVLRGAVLLALPQIPLSVGNSVIATSQTTRDLFPDHAVGVRRIGITYGIMNLVAPWFGGVPVCHGCGGLAGFHGFGARTGGAPVIYGGIYLALGLFLSPGFGQVVRMLPMPVLGVVLLFEAISLMTLIRDVSRERSELWVALVVAAAVVSLPYGYVIGLAVGTAIALGARRGWLQTPTVGTGGASASD
jgi:MFS superfamily sulfate permease-like transporter